MVSAHGVEVLMQSLAMGSADDDREFVAAHAATVLINLSTEEPFKTAVVRGNVVKESLKPLASGCVFTSIRTLYVFFCVLRGFFACFTVLEFRIAVRRWYRAAAVCSYLRTSARTSCAMM